MDNNLFPLPFSIHLMFVIIAILIFSVRFMISKRNYQIIMSAAVALTLTIYCGSSHVWYDCVGISEIVLIIGAIVSVIIDKKKMKTLKAEKEATEQEATE